MKTAIKLFLVLVVALVLGVGSASLVVDRVAERLSIRNGAWITNLAVGSAEADPYTRAAIARASLFALTKSEAVYYQATGDEEGRPLRSRCDYRIEGGDLPARWWSITLYGADYFLIPNPGNRHAFNWQNVARNPDQTYTLRVSPSPKEGNWIPSGRQDQLYLVLRLYHPDKELHEKPATVGLPRIVREGCR
jgi:hypothetical protein